MKKEHFETVRNFQKNKLFRTRLVRLEMAKAYDIGELCEYFDLAERSELVSLLTLYANYSYRNEKFTILGFTDSLYKAQREEFNELKNKFGQMFSDVTNVFGSNQGNLMTVVEVSSALGHRRPKKDEFGEVRKKYNDIVNIVMRLAEIGWLKRMNVEKGVVKYMRAINTKF